MVRCTLKTLWLLVPVLAVASAARAQERYVGGTVIDSVSGAALGGVSVYFTTLPGEGRTTPDGRFRLTGHSMRDSVVVVRRIGYVPRTIIVTPAAPVLATVDIGEIYLRPVATQLDKIAVEVEEVRRFPQLDGFYERKNHLGGLGHFFTREVMERIPAARTSDIIRRSHKVEIECNKGGAGLCAASSRRARETRFTLLTGRDSAGIEDVTLGSETSRCRMEVWVDGVRSPFDIDAIPVSWIVGIEIYSGPATTPPIFGEGACGVVAIWTSIPGA